MSASEDNITAALNTPVRNRFYYGKEMGVSQFQREQRYGSELRWLVNRLALGSGVLCGLVPSASADGTITLSAGVAIDGAGREIVVPETQKLGVTGDPGDVLALWLCYDECCIVPLRGGCGDPCRQGASVEYDAIQASFRCELRKQPPAAPPAGAAPSPPCAPPSEACLRLAVVTLSPAGPVLSQTLSAVGSAGTALVAALLQRVAALEAQVQALGGQAPAEEL